jgi:hypothetical protein
VGKINKLSHKIVRKAEVPCLAQKCAGESDEEASLKEESKRREGLGAIAGHYFYESKILN